MDPWTFALVWLLISGAAIVVFAVVHDAWQRRAASIEPEPRTNWNTTELCMVASPKQCGNEWQVDVHGWRMCHKHAAASTRREGAA